MTDATVRSAPVRPVWTGAPVLRYRTGVEIELLAPPRGDRLALAAEIARRCGGRVERSFHNDSEPSLVPGIGLFLHLTPSFEVRDAALQAAAAATGLTKYYDVNLTQLLTEQPFRDTVEVRILPGAVHGSGIVARAALVEALLDRCLDQRPLPAPRAHRTPGMVQELYAVAGG